MTALLLSVFIVILSLSLLALADNDNYFLMSKERDLRAWCAAYSGIEAYRVASTQMTAGGAAITGTVTVPAGASFQQLWTVHILANGDVVSTGTMVDGSLTLATHTIVVPRGDFALAYDYAGAGP